MEFHEPPFQIDAFENLVQEMTPALYRFAYGLVGNNTDAEDALQETWLDVYHSIDRITMQKTPLRKFWITQLHPAFPVHYARSNTKVNLEKTENMAFLIL